MLRNSLNLFDCELTLIEQDTRNQAFLLIEQAALELHKVILCFTKILLNHPHL